MTNVAILGYGTIGSGVAKVIKENQDVIKLNSGDDVKVTNYPSPILLSRHGKIGGAFVSIYT